MEKFFNYETSVLFSPEADNDGKKQSESQDTPENTDDANKDQEVNIPKEGWHEGVPLENDVYYSDPL